MQKHEKENQSVASRPLRFRAWDKEKKVWARMRLSDWRSWQGASMSQNYPEGQPEIFEHVNDDRWIWMQDTGLKDKNGKEIYEFDIVKLYPNRIRVIEYSEGNAAFMERGSSLNEIHGGTEMEVIGNIYENPDLLNHPTN